MSLLGALFPCHGLSGALCLLSGLSLGSRWILSGLSVCYLGTSGRFGGLSLGSPSFSVGFWASVGSLWAFCGLSVVSRWALCLPPCAHLGGCV